ncbi:phosphonate C-P lyase system protein PhnH [Aquiflexum sp.]|uniref:phosphonate C-P lyase system protein PhnH n=1 Tax=Aquiflexum sp. TaxID=1872584 RepID=UPI003593FBA9
MVRESAYDEIFDAQFHFRQLMEAMSRPGKICKLEHNAISPPEDMHPGAALIGFALLNADVSFYHKGSAAEYLRFNTSSELAAPADADFIFIKGTDEPQMIRAAKIGTDNYPETNATTIIEVLEINNTNHDEGLNLCLSGPGVLGSKEVNIRGLHEDLLEEIRVKNEEFPLGVDCILVDKSGNVCCLPRTCKIECNINDLQNI